MTVQGTERALAPLRLRALGIRVAVRFDDGFTPLHVATLRRAWSRCLDGEGRGSDSRGSDGDGRVGEQTVLGPVAPSASAGAFRGRVESPHGIWPVAAGSFEQFAADLTSVVTLAAIESRAGELMMLHASALADPASGRAVALVGRSGMGKTTATRELGATFGYITDETVAVDREGRIAQYPKPLSIIVGSRAAPKSQVGPEELGLLPAPASARLAAVVLLDRDPEAPCPRVVPLGHAEAIIGLAPQTSALSRADRPLEWLCTLLDACGGAVRVTYREAHELPALMEGLLARRPLEARWAPARAAGTNAADDGGARQGGLLHRGRVVDAVEVPAASGLGTELLAMVGSSVVRLAGVAPAVWRALATPASLELLASRIEREVVLPPDHRVRLLEAVTELERHSLLRRAEAGH